MKPLARLLLIFLFFSGVANGSLRTAGQARTALGSDVWARVVQIENTSARSVYPKTVYAVVFEFSGILWFYTDVNGTQSFSMHRGRLAEEKADFSALLREIDPGFVSFKILPDSGPEFAGPPPPLPNGCFIDSVLAFRARIERGEPITGAALLCYYPGGPSRLGGHTVLAYETAAGLFVIDAARSKQPFRLRQGSISSDPAGIASAVAGESINQARWLPLRVARAEGLADLKSQISLKTE